MLVNDEIIKEINTLLCEELPNFYIDTWSQVNNETIYATISDFALKNSKYSFEYKNKRLLHFTNLDSAKKILTSKYLRASNFSSFKDKFEISLALSLASIQNTEMWNNYKKYHFALSFTEKVHDLVRKNYGYHWENFANQGKGVAFEFEIIRKPLKPKYFVLRVSYLDEVKYDRLLTRIKSQKINEVTVTCLLPILSTFKKKEKYSEENEIRLLYSSDSIECESSIYNNSYERIVHSFDNDNNIIFHIEVPFITPAENHNLQNSFLLKLYRIHISDLTSCNDGAISLNAFFEPYCKKNKIELIW